MIYKRDLEDAASDIRESSFAKTMWPVEVCDREGAWSMLVEALSLGVNKDQVAELAAKWGCDDAGAYVYAGIVGVELGVDQGVLTATRKDFVNLQESECGYGNTYLEAMADLCKRLGYKCGKMWNTTFKDLLKEKK